MSDVDYWRRLDISILPWMLLLFVMAVAILGFVAA
jgi:hypothetical protein